jgi:polygalacturonase
LAVTVLAVAVLVVGNALIHPQAAQAPANHLNPQSVTPNHPSRPTGRVNGFVTIQAALDATAPGGTLTFPKGGTYIVATPLVVPSNITVNGNGYYAGI